MFCEYLVDARYGWAQQCQDRFGTHPVQICHEWNTATHTSAFEGRPAVRPFTRAERTSTGRSRPRCRAVSGPASWRCCTVNGSATRPRHRSGPRCLMKASTWVRSRRSTGSCTPSTATCASAGRKPPTRAKVKPELVAHGPNEVWSWDITKLHGPAKWSYFYLYAVLDVFSRKSVGWMVATRESAVLAEQLLAATIKAENVPAKQLTIHADRGSSMASKPVALLLADLGVTKTHSRPRVSNDCEYELVATSRVWPL